MHYLLQTVKRPTSANSTSSNSRSSTTNNNTNQRTRSHSSTTSMASNRSTSNTTAPASRASLKTKPTKTIKSSAPISTNPTPSNLLGQVDLDDEDDLLAKYQTKKQHNKENLDEFTSKMNNIEKKLHSNIQTIIDTKWNAYGKGLNDSEEEQEVNNNDDDDDDELYSTTRQRTSSHSSGIQSKVIITANPSSNHQKRVK